MQVFASFLPLLIAGQTGFFNSAYARSFMLVSVRHGGIDHVVGAQPCPHIRLYYLRPSMKAQTKSKIRFFGPRRFYPYQFCTGLLADEKGPSCNELDHQRSEGCRPLHGRVASRTIGRGLCQRGSAFPAAVLSYASALLLFYVSPSPLDNIPNTKQRSLNINRTYRVSLYSSINSFTNQIRRLSRNPDVQDSS